MEIKEHRLLLFIKMYEKDFGITLSRSEAHEKAMSLLNYAYLFIKPLAEVTGDDINTVSNASK